MMVEWQRDMPAWRPVRATTRAKEAHMSSSGWRRTWCARGGEECEDRKGLLEGAVMASSPAGRKMADSTSYLADSSLKWLREVG
jgi:hypothetical protein